MTSIDPKVTNNLYQDLIVNKKGNQDNSAANLERIEPNLVLPAENVGQKEKNIGLNIIKKGKVAVVILAGG